MESTEETANEIFKVKVVIYKMDKCSWMEQEKGGLDDFPRPSNGRNSSPKFFLCYLIPDWDGLLVAVYHERFGFSFRVGRGESIGRLDGWMD